MNLLLCREQLVATFSLGTMVKEQQRPRAPDVVTRDYTVNLHKRCHRVCVHRRRRNGREKCSHR